MPELEAVEAPKIAGFVNPDYNNANKRRIKEDEEAMEELLATDKEEEESVEEVKEAVSEEKDESLTGEERTYKKRYSDLRSHQNKQADEIKLLKTQLDNAQERGDIRPPKSDEDIAAWAKEYPDIAAIVETIAEKKASEKFAGAESRLQEIDRITEEAGRTKLESEIRAIHPDFDELRSSDEFHDWAGEQPKWCRDALYDNTDDPASVTRVIDLYKVDKGMDTKTRKRSSKQAASAVVTKRSTKPNSKESSNSFTESQVQKMSSSEFEKNSDAIMEAIRSDNFTYDVTGGAR